MKLIAVFLIGLIVFSGCLKEQEPELYSSYADLSIFKDGKVSIDFVRTHCIQSKDSHIWKCRADLVFNDRAVGFVNFHEIREKQEKVKDK